ncbi:MAG TPA: tape measure protein, partial [Planctomycetaceae bacterium]|nr:tape measure protein [Planctomycetaceae bacterium]
LAKQFGVATGPLKAMSEALGTASTKFTQFTSQAGAVKNGVAGIGYVMTGTFAKGGSSADIFARSMMFALLPLRLLKREFDGANRVVRATMHVFNALTSPVRLVTNTFARMRAETAVFNQVVSKLPAKLQAPAKAFYYLAQAARVPIIAVLAVSKAVTTVLGPLGRLGGSAIAKASTGLRSLAVSASGFIGRAIGLRSAAKGAADSIDSMGAAAGRSSGGIMSLIPGLGQAGKFAFAAKAGVAALAAGIVMWGSSSAIATESATVSFGTMLKDMDQGKAVIAAITKFSGETPFSNSDLRDAGKLLLTAQVPADQLIGKLRMLGDVASGTGKPIEEYAAIFQKVKNTGKFGLEQINQLAERGVPIYGQLQSQLGVTREELGTMISAGKLGFNDMEKALEGLTTGQGLFAGGMAAKSQTFAGLWSTLKDNVAIVLEKIVGGFTMMLKPAMSFAIVVLQKIATGFTALEPVIMGVMASVSSMMNSVWTGIQSVVSSVFGSIFGDTSGTFDSIITYAAMMMGAAGYAFENLGTIASFAFKSAQLSAAIWINDIVYFFSATMPAYLTWFGDNFANIFLDAAAIVGTVFSNIGANIMAA